MEFAEAEEAFDEERLVIGGAILIEGDGGGSGAARGVEVTGAGVGGIEGVTLEGRVAVVNDTAEGERAAAEHSVTAPAFPGAQIDAAIVELFIADGGVGRKGRAEGVGRRRDAAEIGRAAGIDILVGVPAFSLDEPVFAELQFVTQNAGVAIDPVVIVGGDGAVGIELPLLIIEPAWIFAIEAIGVDVEGEELMRIGTLAE